MSLRILEIGHLNFIKEAFPAETERIDTNFVLLTERGTLAKVRAVAGQLVRLCRAAVRPPSDLVFCRCLGRFIYRRELSLPVNVLRLAMSWFVKLCVWAQVARGATLAVVDQLDESTIDDRDWFLLRRCRWYFKRELPQNVWNIYLRVQPRHGEFNDLTTHPAYTSQLHKFAPVSIGITVDKVRRIEAVASQMADEEKTIDVFFAGLAHRSTVRVDGLSQLQELSRRGYRVEVYEESLPFEEFVAKMRRAWLVWSPEGQGWDCYRHYEACVAGSVPLINQAGIRRHEPLLPGVHCVQYAVEGDDLCRQAEAALANRDALRAMAAAGREHVFQFHTHAKLGEYMVRHVMEAK